VFLEEDRDMIPSEQGNDMTKVKVRIGESIDKALRLLKKKVDKEGVMKTIKANRYHLKRSIKKRIKSKNAQRYRRQQKGRA